MDLSFLNEKTTAVIMIVLGILALAFPMISTGTIGILTGVIVLILAIGLLISGIAELSVSKFMAVLSIIMSLICIVFAHQLIFNPALVSSIIGILVYLLGFILIIIGIIALLSGSYFAPFSIIGLTTIIFGIITILTGVFVRDPSVLGSIIGIWLIVSGLLSLFSDKEKSYIDIKI